MDEINGKLKEKGKKIDDHSGVEYLPYRKSFYFEVPELAKMSDALVEECRTELEGMKVKGNLPKPKPIKNWSCELWRTVETSLKFSTL